MHPAWLLMFVVWLHCACLLYNWTEKNQLVFSRNVLTLVLLVFQFLTYRNYPKTFTPKALQTPTSRDFFHIFNVSSLEYTVWYCLFSLIPRLYSFSSLLHPCTSNWTRKLEGPATQLPTCCHPGHGFDKNSNIGLTSVVSYVPSTCVAYVLHNKASPIIEFLPSHS